MSYPNNLDEKNRSLRGNNTSISLPPEKDAHGDDELWDLADMRASFFIGETEKITVRLYKQMQNIRSNSSITTLKIIGADEQEINREDVVVAPDGGWGWFVVFASFMSNLIVDGIIYSFGVFIEPIRESDPTIKVSTISWVGSLLPGFYLIVGPFVSAFSNKLGFRTAAIFGSILAGLGFMFAWLLNYRSINIVSLMMFYGVVGGIGFGFIYIPSIVTVGFYFEKKRALATGIAISASGVGTFIFAPLMKFLIDKWGWETSILIQAIIVFFTSLLGLFYLPLKPKRITEDQRKKLEARNAEARLKGTRTQSPSPDGTPLMIRIKRARDMEKWETESYISAAESGKGMEIVNHVKNKKGKVPLIPPISSRRGSADSEKNSSHHSLNHDAPGNNVIPPGKLYARRGSAPNAITPIRTDENSHNNAISPLPSPTPVVPGVPRASLRNKSFAGLPDLKEIAEEGNSDELISPNSPISPIEEEHEALQHLHDPTSGNASVANMDGMNRTSTVLTIAQIGHSILTMNEGNNRSKILRVESTKDFINKPMYRDDIFFTGSMSRVPEYSEHLEGDNPIFSSREWAAVMSRVPLDQKKKKMKKCAFFLKMLDFSLILSPTFSILALSGFLTMMGIFTPFMYLTGIACENMATSDEEMEELKHAFRISFLISIIGISNTVGRVIVGWAADRPHVNPLMINNIALTVGGALTIFVPFFHIYAAFVVYVIVFGITLACWASLRSILIVELLGLNSLTNAFGLLCLFQGIAALIGSPVSAMLYDSTGNYNISFYVAGAFLLLSGIVCYPLHFINRCEKRREARKLAIKEKEALYNNVNYQYQ